MAVFPTEPARATFGKVLFFQAFQENDSSAWVCFQSPVSLTVFLWSPRAGTEHRLTALPSLEASSWMSHGKMSPMEWWGLCLNPSQPTWLVCHSGKSLFPPCPVSLFSRYECQGFVKQRWFGLDCYVKSLCSFWICCRLSHQASLISRCFSTTRAMTLFALCTKKSSSFRIFAFHLCFLL